ncbi:MAG: type II toxin-antitoxin system VapC family toxin [Chthoniobacterales bacterium]
MEARAYADSSYLVSLHRADEHHERARSFVGKNAISLWYTSLHRLEVRNALRNAASREQITAAACRAAFRQIEADLRDGLLIFTAVNWTDALGRAEQLSERHAPEHGQRAIDLLHVAIALEIGAASFLSFDKRQRQLAQVAGLKVKP